jgi:hypothetical protein
VVVVVVLDPVERVDVVPEPEVLPPGVVVVPVAPDVVVAVEIEVERAPPWEPESLQCRTAKRETVASGLRYL